MFNYVIVAMHITARTHPILSNRVPQTTTHPFEIPDGNHSFEDLVAYTKSTGEQAAKRARICSEDAFISGTMTGGAYGVIIMGCVLNNLDVVLLGAQCLGYSAAASVALDVLQKKKFPPRTNVFFKFTLESARIAKDARNKARDCLQWVRENTAEMVVHKPAPDTDGDNTTPIHPITGAPPA